MLDNKGSSRLKFNISEVLPMFGLTNKLLNVRIHAWLFNLMTLRWPFILTKTYSDYNKSVREQMVSWVIVNKRLIIYIFKGHYRTILTIFERIFGQTLYIYLSKTHSRTSPVSDSVFKRRL